MWALLSQLSIPFLALTVLAITIIIGRILARILDARRKKKSSSFVDSSDDASLLRSEQIEVHYPSFALFTSLSITIVKFFYFGTALASHQYLFPVTQQVTGIKYSQHSPWMRYSEALPLILASIPSILIFDFGLPVAFMVLCWKVRKRFGEPSVQIYFGTLFETYNPRCFWWEIVNILKKLTVALALRSFPDDNALQSTLVASILLITLVAQTTSNPWRRRTENIADGISTAILCGALIWTRPTQLQGAHHVMWYILALSILFTLGSIGVIAWQTIAGITDYQRRVALYWNEHDPQGLLQERLDAADVFGWRLESEPEHTLDFG